MKDDRIIIPSKLQPERLDKIHGLHLGIIKSKQLARDYIFWPGMNKQVENKVSRCTICQSFRNKPDAEPLISHDIPVIPYTKLGIDFFQVQDRHFILFIDYHSKYPEIVELKHATSTETIKNN